MPKNALFACCHALEVPFSWKHYHAFLGGLGETLLESCYIAKLYFQFQKDLYCKFKLHPCWNLAMFQDAPMSKCPELVNTKKAGGSDFNHQRAVSSNGKVFLSLGPVVNILAIISNADILKKIRE